ncbi:MAG: LacI family transcriptional regulator [Propionibacteriaceae bacterium]|nr:LacI family transcriptional regulator [Propionibacteriaceae bacterium]
MPSSSRVSIADVAQEAKVSLGTVSNVLNHPDVVAAPTRQRVLDVIDELGYTPNSAARQLRSGSSLVVGVVVMDLRNPFYTEVARGIGDRLDRADYALLIGSSDNDPAREARHLRAFLTHGVAGVIIVPTRHGDQGALRGLVEAGTPVVLLESTVKGLDLPCVRSDNIVGGRLAGAHLLDCGARSLAMFNGPHSIRQCRERAHGARDALRAADLNPDWAFHEVTVPSLDSAGGDAAAHAWLARHGGAPPAALFCVNDLVAIGAQRAFRSAGVYDPARCRIVGYDDIGYATELITPLSSVRQPTYQMGYHATELLLADDPVPVAEPALLPELVVRASTVG